jgi:HlyD family secretion protein
LVPFVAMDIAREGIVEAKRRRHLLLTVVGGVALTVATVGLSRLKPAAPTIERGTVWIDTVKRGSMLREVKGTGTLVPQEIRWIPAATDGRVERILVEPGSAVEAGTVLLELSNQELELQAVDAESQHREARAKLDELRVRLESERLQQESSAAQAQGDYEQAKLDAEITQQLAREGLTSAMALKKAEFLERKTAGTREMEQKKLAIAGDAVKAQLAAMVSQVERQRAVAELKRSNVRALRVPAGIAGVLQRVDVEVGQRVAPGVNLARVAQPERLKAVVRIPETQAGEVQIGYKASVDTRNGVVAAHVSRVDPAVKEGTVTVDLALDGALPRGVRPDLTVDGTIEIERLENVLYVGRPASAPAQSAVALFRLQPGTREALRAKVKLGRASVSTVEVVDGLAEGDQVIVSDTSEWDAHDRVRIE